VHEPADAAARRPAWLSGSPGRWILEVHAQPGARRSECAGEHDGALKLRIHAPAIEGRANAELLRWVATRLGLARRDVELVSGAGGRAKRVRIDAQIPAEEVVARLLAGAARGPHQGRSP